MKLLGRKRPCSSQGELRPLANTPVATMMGVSSRPAAASSFDDCDDELDDSDDEWLAPFSLLSPLLTFERLWELGRREWAASERPQLGAAPLDKFLLDLRSHVILP